jgi:hypothetical protein
MEISDLRVVVDATSGRAFGPLAIIGHRIDL